MGEIGSQKDQLLSWGRTSVAVCRRRPGGWPPGSDTLAPAAPATLSACHPHAQPFQSRPRRLPLFRHSFLVLWRLGRTPGVAAPVEEKGKTRERGGWAGLRGGRGVGAVRRGAPPPLPPQPLLQRPLVPTEGQLLVLVALGWVAQGVGEGGEREGEGGGGGRDGEAGGEEGGGAEGGGRRGAPRR
eukprot:COSAG04_NODE_216_length_19953_cov_85.343558_18_plen_185_part_00